MKHWPVLLLAIGVVLLGLSAMLERAGRVEAEGRTRMYEDSAAEWRGRHRADSLALVELKAKAAKADTVYLARVDTFRVRDSVWLALPDTASVETVRAAADSTITACRSALHACAVARAGYAEVVLGYQRVNADLRGQVRGLTEANAILRAQTTARPSWVPTLLLPAIGCGAFQLAGESCFAGIAAGLGADVLRRAFNSYRQTFAP